ncbi:MAG: hypothetical protein VKN56_01155 [Cyanobacteriota bacterium]|nr:hypothetical protein [Cyanobacteriota bacterium]
MRNSGQQPAATSRITRAGRRAGQGLGCVVALLGGTLAGCQWLPRETPQATAKPGDALVRVGKTVVTLVKPFRQGEPNGLFDGVIRVTTEGNNQPVLMEINAICSLPNEPGWPSYDNLYGRILSRAEEAVGRSGDTQWQVLYNFSGIQDVRMGQKPGSWTDRLRNNLCRREDFDDRPKK